MLPSEIWNKIRYMYHFFIGEESPDTVTVMLPPEIWNKILYHAFIGQEGPDIDTLDKCRQVCREWNEMIKRSVWQKPNKEWGIITKCMIEKNWSLGVFRLTRCFLMPRD